MKETLKEVGNTLRTTNPDYDLVIDRLYLYYNMQLITFGIGKDRNLIIQFLVFIQPYTQQPLILYQLETVSIPILDQNNKAQSYMQLQIRKPYIALNAEAYISLRLQELKTCKRIGYEFYCKKLFVVKHKTSYSCESAIYFNLDTNIMNENCNFRFYYNKTDVIPTVLDCGNEIILANWPNDKHIICTSHNDIPVKIPSHPYVLVNRSVLCNCGIEADNHYLLESLAACEEQIFQVDHVIHNQYSFCKLPRDVSYLTESLQLLLIKNITMYEQIFPVNLSVSGFDKTLLHVSTNLKDFLNNYIRRKEIFD